MKMTPRYSAYASPAGTSVTKLKSMSTAEEAEDDDEFSDFKSGLVLPAQGPLKGPPAYPPLLSTNLLQYTSSPTHSTSHKNCQRTLDSPLPNHHTGLDNEERCSSSSSLIGDEDKYSPLRQFLQSQFETTQESPQLTHSQPSVDADFGDFQSFTQPSTADRTFTPAPNTVSFTPAPFLPKPAVVPLTVGNRHSDQSLAQSSAANDDFGDFVSFSGGDVSIPQHIPSPHPTAPQQSIVAAVDLLQIGISNPMSNKSIQTKSVVPDRANSFLFELSAAIEGAGKAPPPPPRALPLDTLAPLKTTLISGPATDLDPFGDFLSSSSPKNPLAPEDFPRTYNQSSKKCTPDTMSVSSLDLGNYGASSLESSVTSLGKGLNSVPKDALRSSPLLCNEDKYTPFKQEQELEALKSTKDWRRILEKCVKLIEEGETFFHSVSSSDILRQVIQTEKGRAYVLSLRQVYLVACRVYQSWMRSGGNEILSELHQKLALAWDSISPFLLGTNLEEDFRRRSPMWDEDAENVCGICLVGTGWRDGAEEESWRLSLDFGGTVYHLPCANLWLNQVDSLLPTLSPQNKSNCTTHHFQTLI